MSFHLSSDFIFSIQISYCFYYFSPKCSFFFLPIFKALSLFQKFEYDAPRCDLSELRFLLDGLISFIKIEKPPAFSPSLPLHGALADF